MKKIDLKKIALMGIASSGLLLAPAQATAHDTNTSEQSQKQMTSDQLYSILSPEGKAAYDKLDSEGKKLALEMANQTCAGKNSCKGKNSCATADHGCQGQGSCQGTAPGPFADKNDAVKLAAKIMAEKRQNLSK